jgi:riboflavin kinase/FMN adenylyltransferase
MKQKLFAKLHIEVLLELPFDQGFAKIAPAAFIKEILHAGLDCRGIVVGYNFTFGAFGRGTPALLEEMATEFDYQLKVVPPVKLGPEVVSSTLIRRLLLEGQVTEAANFLGYVPFAEGVVVPGEKRGGALGYPTANIDIDQGTLVPANGVYSVKTQIGPAHIPGVANVGHKPTFAGKNRNIEVHLLDFHQDLYGQEIKVEFIKRIRPEKKFFSPTDLVRQIEQDILVARQE